jgi:hypothetical protein
MEYEEHQPQKVRPIQMGEFLRKYVSKRLLALSDKDIAKLMVALRQLGVGTPGGMEALGILHQLIYDAWVAGKLTTPLARIKVDEKNYFGKIEWKAIREASRQMLPRHTAVAAWKHAASSSVEQEGVAPAPKDRGAEQGDVDGPLECSITLAQVARKTRITLARLQRQEDLPWIADNEAGAASARADFDGRTDRTRTFEAGPETDEAVRIDPRHEVQDGGGLADFWYLDDGDILCHPFLVLSYLTAFDVANNEIGAERNVQKTEVIYYATGDELERHSGEWKLEQVWAKASVSLASDGTRCGNRAFSGRYRPAV